MLCSNSYWGFRISRRRHRILFPDVSYCRAIRFLFVSTNCLFTVSAGPSHNFLHLLRTSASSNRSLNLSLTSFCPLIPIASSILPTLPRTGTNGTRPIPRCYSTKLSRISRTYELLVLITDCWSAARASVCFFSDTQKLIFEFYRFWNSISKDTAQ